MKKLDLKYYIRWYYFLSFPHHCVSETYLKSGDRSETIFSIFYSNHFILYLPVSFSFPPSFCSTLCISSILKFSLFIAISVKSKYEFRGLKYFLCLYTIIKTWDWICAQPKKITLNCMYFHFDSSSGKLRSSST